jgi:mRNA-degrading endonuclease RelE of RelBE toxin-antitoxin system
MSPQFVSLVTDALAEIGTGHVYHTWLEWALGYLDDIWYPKPPSLYSTCPSPDEEEPKQAPAKRPPPWYIGMSSGFRKAISDIDRKLQGRILEALTEISENPTTIRGDTIKPLASNLKGCWRYRIGDYRLVYSPDLSSGDITLLAFASRGPIYGA